MKYLRTAFITAFVAVALAVPALADIITKPTSVPVEPDGAASWLNYVLLIVAVGVIVVVIIASRKKKGGKK